MDKRLTQGMLVAWGTLLLFAMHYLQPNAGGDGLYIANNSLSWIAISLICGCGGAIIIASQKLRWHPLLSAFGLTLVLLVVPYLWSPSPWVGESIDRLFGLLGWFILAAALLQTATKPLLSKLLWLLTMAIAAQALFGLYQFFFPEQFIAIKGHRPAGSFMQTNVYGSLLATGMAVCTWLYHQYQEKAVAKPILLLLALCAGLNVLVLSRTGMLGSALAVMVMLLLLRDRKTTIHIAATSVIGVALGLALQTSIDGAGRDNLTNPGYRTTQYSQSWELIKEKPFLGHGIGSFQSVYTEKLAAAYQQDPTTIMITQAASHPHNELLFWWVEGGVLPIIAIIGFALCFSWYVWRRGNRFNQAMWVTCIPIALHCMTEYPLYHSTAHLGILTLLMVAAWPQTLTTERPWQTQLLILPKFFVVLGVLLTIIAMGTNLHTTKQVERFFKEPDHKHLVKIINPHFQPRVMNMLLGRSLLSSGDPQAIRVTKEIAQHEVTVRPSFGALLLLYNAALADGDNALAEQTVAQMRYLFPKSEKQSETTNLSAVAATEVTAHSLPASAAQ